LKVVGVFVFVRRSSKLYFILFIFCFYCSRYWWYWWCSWLFTFLIMNRWALYSLRYRSPLLKKYSTLLISLWFCHYHLILSQFNNLIPICFIWFFLNDPFSSSKFKNSQTQENCEVYLLDKTHTFSAP
jgi:hypothetical protein